MEVQRRSTSTVMNKRIDDFIRSVLQCCYDAVKGYLGETGRVIAFVTRKLREHGMTFISYLAASTGYTLLFEWNGFRYPVIWGIGTAIVLGKREPLPDTERVVWNVDVH